MTKEEPVYPHLYNEAIEIAIEQGDFDYLKVLLKKKENSFNTLWGNLSEKEKEKILIAEAGSNFSKLKEADKAVKNDTSAKPVDWVVFRDSIFTVLNPQGDPVITTDQAIIDRADNRKAKQAEKDRIHLERMLNDPKYAAEWEEQRKAMLRGFISGEPTGVQKPYFF